MTGIWENAGEAAEYIGSRIGTIPKTAVVLGSGLGPLAGRLRNSTAIDYETIPHFPEVTVAGHIGRLIAGMVGEVDVLYLQGRFHYYEGHSLEATTFPIRVLARLGVKTLILTAATGGIRPGLKPGDIVTLSDHLNLIGGNPLRGLNDDRLGPRFPDMTEVYSKALRELAAREGARLGIAWNEGVYAALPGPSYETPAEIGMLRTLGADVVGMSTVPEAIVARHSGIDVLGFALVTNAAAGLMEDPVTHEVVLKAGVEAGPRLGALIEAVVQSLDQGPS